MRMQINLPGGDQVDAVFGDQTITTNQDGSAPAPFELFLASMGTCAGIYVAKFCQRRGIPTDGVTIEQRTIPDPDSGLVGKLEIEIRLPEDFPEEYRDAVVRSAQLCTVKKHLERPPAIAVSTTKASVASN